jgi:hypothetical protein
MEARARVMTYLNNQDEFSESLSPFSLWEKGWG